MRKLSLAILISILGAYPSLTAEHRPSVLTAEQFEETNKELNELEEKIKDSLELIHLGQDSVASHICMDAYYKIFSSCMDIFRIDSADISDVGEEVIECWVGKFGELGNILRAMINDVKKSENCSGGSDAFSISYLFSSRIGNCFHDKEDLKFLKNLVEQIGNEYKNRCAVFVEIFDGKTNFCTVFEGKIKSAEQERSNVKRLNIMKEALLDLNKQMKEFFDNKLEPLTHSIGEESITKFFNEQREKLRVASNIR